jgi:hypothetical protein
MSELQYASVVQNNPTMTEWNYKICKDNLPACVSVFFQFYIK